MKTKLPAFFKILFFILIGAYYAIAQEKKEKTPIEVTGSIGFHYDHYSFSQENFATFRPRYPENLLRFNAQMNIKYGEHLSIPIGVNITNQEILYNVPSVPEENVLDFIQNPANNISINPKYKWAQGFFGTQTPLYTPLTTGDIPIFGIGVEINPEKFILSATTGKSQRAIEPDTALNIPGAYEQNIVAARIGVGKLEGTKFTLNMVRIKDDVSSVSTAPIGVQPIEGATLSPYAEFKLFEKLHIRSETAGSVYTSDVLNTGTIDDNYVNALDGLITVNASSTADISHNSRIDWKADKYQLGGEIQYIGPGFLPVGYRFVERDILDYKLNTGVNLLKDKVNFTGSFGIRTNNLSDTKLSSSRRIISNANLFYQITESFSLNINYSNFGFNNDANLLNQRIELVNNSITISPSYTIKSKKYTHLISSNVALNSFEQFDVVNNAFENAKNESYAANYNLSFLQIPLNLGLQTIYIKNQLPTGDFNMLNYGLIASYKMFDKKFTPSIGLNLAHINIPSFTTDYRTNLNLKLGYKLTKKLQCKLRYRYINLKYGDSRPNAVVGQNRVQFSIQQRF